MADAPDQPDSQTSEATQEESAPEKKHILLGCLTLLVLTCVGGMIWSALTGGDEDEPERRVAGFGVPRQSVLDMFQTRADFGFARGERRGQPLLVGKSPDGLIVVEMAGPPDDLVWAKMSTAVTTETAAAQAVHLARFVAVLTPGHEAESNKWLNESLQTAMEQGPVQTAFGDARVELSTVPAIGMIQLTVESKAWDELP